MGIAIPPSGSLKAVIAKKPGEGCGADFVALILYEAASGRKCEWIMICRLRDLSTIRLKTYDSSYSIFPVTHGLVTNEDTLSCRRAYLSAGTYWLHYLYLSVEYTDLLAVLN